MKKLLDIHNLPKCALGLGVLGFILRFALYLTAVDEKNLLLRSHPLEWALWLLAALTAGLVVYQVRNLDGASRYAHNFAPSLSGALGSGAFGIAILLTVLGTGLPENRLVLAGQAAGLLAAGSLLWAAVCRWRGETPFFLLPVAVCLYMALFMINHYQQWSSNPQLQDYVFQLLAVVCLTLFAYDRAAVTLNMSSGRLLVAAGLLGAFGGIVALAHTREGLIYLTGAMWCLTGLRLPEPVQPQEEAPAETDGDGL